MSAIWDVPITLDGNGSAVINLVETDDVNNLLTCEEEVDQPNVYLSDDEDIREGPIVDGVSEKKGHQTGPRSIAYISEKKERMKAFSKRKSTLIKKAKELVSITGCHVEMTIYNPNGKVANKGHYSSRNLSKRHMSCQVKLGKETIPPRQREKRTITHVANEHSPAKKSLPHKCIDNLPGKKSNK